MAPTRRGPLIDVAEVRAALARARVRHDHFADLCGVNANHLSSVLSGDRPLGELTARKIVDGLAVMGLDRQARSA